MVRIWIKRGLIALGPAIVWGCAAQRPLAPRNSARTLFNELDTANPKAPANPALPTHEGANQNVSFDSFGTGTASKQETVDRAEKRAEEDALAQALKSAGVDTYYGFSDLVAQGNGKSIEAVSRYLWTFSSGVATWERAGPPKCELSGDQTTKCAVRIRGRVTFRGRPDPSFNILLKDGGAGLGISQPAYRNGDSVEVAFKITQDARVYLLSVDSENNVYLLMPNQLFPDSMVKGGEVYRFPQGDSGLSLKAVLPEGLDSATEVLQIIATKGQKLFALEGMETKMEGPYRTVAAGKLNGVMAKLAGLDRSSWEMAVLPYEIVGN